MLLLTECKEICYSASSRVHTAALPFKTRAIQFASVAYRADAV